MRKECVILLIMSNGWMKMIDVVIEEASPDEIRAGSEDGGEIVFYKTSEGFEIDGHSCLVYREFGEEVKGGLIN